MNGSIFPQGEWEDVFCVPHQFGKDVFGDSPAFLRADDLHRAEYVLKDLPLDSEEFSILIQSLDKIPSDKLKLIVSAAHQFIPFFQELAEFQLFFQLLSKQETLGISEIIEKLFSFFERAQRKTNWHNVLFLLNQLQEDVLLDGITELQMLLQVLNLDRFFISLPGLIKHIPKEKRYWAIRQLNREPALLKDPRFFYGYKPYHYETQLSFWVKQLSRRQINLLKRESFSLLLLPTSQW